MEKTDEKKRLLDFQKKIHDRIGDFAKEKGLWKPDYKLILDGVNDIPGYLSSKPKIMWVLKEAWGKEDENGELTGGDYEIWKCWDKKGFNTPTWLTMIYILYGIRQGSNRV